MRGNHVTGESGFIDLHSHYLPGIDDGVRSSEEGRELCMGLAKIGFGQVVATPHIRTAMFDNRPEELRQHFTRFVEKAQGLSGMPELGLGAEHYFDDVFVSLFESGEALLYPGNVAVLIELPPERLPLGLEEHCFQMKLKGIIPVIAHPERYTQLFKQSAPLVALTEVGARPLLDVMSLAGKYGRRPKKAAERMLDEGLYFAACSDAHKPRDLSVVEKAIGKLRKRVGTEGVDVLMRERPKALITPAEAA